MIPVLSGDDANLYLGQKARGDLQRRFVRTGNRISAAWGKFNKLRRVLVNKHLSIKGRPKLFNAVVIPAALFGLSTLPVTSRQLEQLDICQRKMLRCIVGWRRDGDESWEETMRRMNARVSSALQQHPVLPWSSAHHANQRRFVMNLTVKNAWPTWSPTSQHVKHMRVVQRTRARKRVGRSTKASVNKNSSYSRRACCSATLANRAQLAARHCCSDRATSLLDAGGLCSGLRTRPRPHCMLASHVDNEASRERRRALACANVRRGKVSRAPAPASAPARRACCPPQILYFQPDAPAVLTDAAAEGLSGATCEQYKLLVDDAEALELFTYAANLLVTAHVPADTASGLGLSRFTALKKGVLMRALAACCQQLAASLANSCHQPELAAPASGTNNQAGRLHITTPARVAGRRHARGVIVQCIRCSGDRAGLPSAGTAQTSGDGGPLHVTVRELNEVDPALRAWNLCPGSVQALSRCWPFETSCTAGAGRI
ncbi:XI-F [Symbiodinium sp. CCMP2592]|nr:XI-F [Symbiodinium sp. CCMP2592]